MIMILTLISLLLVNGVPASMPNSQQAQPCDPTLWMHVYNPSRLQVIKDCISVTGVIESKRAETDGDYHIRVKLDEPYQSVMINNASLKYQGGDLVVEPVCAHPVNMVNKSATIEKEQSGCKDFKNYDMAIPKVGTHVMVTGSYVLDKEHHNWAEIHPATSIIPTTATPEFQPLLILVATMTILFVAMRISRSIIIIINTQLLPR
jgi:hypothetical protein